MTDEPMTSATVPDYGEGTLSDLANSLLASLGVGDAADPLALAPTRRACLLIVDGLGWELSAPTRQRPRSSPSSRSPGAR